MLGPLVAALKVQFDLFKDPDDIVKNALKALSLKHDFVVLIDRPLFKLIKWQRVDVQGESGPMQLMRPHFNLAAVMSHAMQSSDDAVLALSNVRQDLKADPAGPLLQLKKKMTPIEDLPSFAAELVSQAELLLRHLVPNPAHAWGFLHLESILPLREKAVKDLEFLITIPPAISGHRASSWASAQPGAASQQCPRAWVQQRKQFFNFTNGNLSQQGLCTTVHAIRVDRWHAYQGEDSLRLGPLPSSPPIDVEKLKDKDQSPRNKPSSKAPTDGISETPQDATTKDEAPRASSSGQNCQESVVGRASRQTPARQYRAPSNILPTPSQTPETQDSAKRTIDPETAETPRKALKADESSRPAATIRQLRQDRHDECGQQ